MGENEDSDDRRRGSSFASLLQVQQYYEDHLVGMFPAILDILIVGTVHNASKAAYVRFVVCSSGVLRHRRGNVRHGTAFLVEDLIQSTT